MLLYKPPSKEGLLFEKTKQDFEKLQQKENK